MQRGVIAFVLQAPEVLHAQTLGGNMLSRDSTAHIPVSYGLVECSCTGEHMGH